MSSNDKNTKHNYSSMTPSSISSKSATGLSSARDKLQRFHDKRPLTRSQRELAKSNESSQETTSAQIELEQTHYFDAEDDISMSDNEFRHSIKTHMADMSSQIKMLSDAFQESLRQNALLSRNHLDKPVPSSTDTNDVQGSVNDVHSTCLFNRDANLHFQSIVQQIDLIKDKNYLKISDTKLIDRFLNNNTLMFDGIIFGPKRTEEFLDFFSAFLLRCSSLGIDSPSDMTFCLISGCLGPNIRKSMLEFLSSHEFSDTDDVFQYITAKLTELFVSDSFYSDILDSLSSWYFSNQIRRQAYHGLRTIEHFVSKISYIPDSELPNTRKFDIFIKMLRPETSQFVRLQNVISLELAIAYARQYENTIPRSILWRDQNRFRNSQSNRETKTKHFKSEDTKKPLPTNAPGPARSKQQHDQYMQQGQCFNCGFTKHRTSSCLFKRQSNVFNPRHQAKEDLKIVTENNTESNNIPEDQNFQ